MRLLTAVSAGLLGASAIAACGSPGLPESVLGGSAATVAWSGVLTTANAASATASQADRDVATLTRSGFARILDGQVQADTSFGQVSIVAAEPFTVRYDLAEPEWSDGIVIDSSDLLLAWAAGARSEAGFTPAGDDLAAAGRIVEVEESARAIEVTFTSPEPEWSTALDVALPAHVVGRLAFGTTDPMEAKKRVADAVRDEDAVALAKIARVWNTGFALDGAGIDASEEGSDRARRLLLSSGPYRIERLTTDAAGRHRTHLVANPRYRGAQKPTYASIVASQQPEAERLASLGQGNDLVELTPTRDNRAAVAALERRDHPVATGDDGTLWAIVLRGDRGLFDGPRASAAFLRSLPRSAMIESGGGGWAEAYAAADSLLVAPSSKNYDLALQDTGFTSTIGRAGSGTEDIVAAGLRPGTPVCVGYDTGSEFARGAVRAMRAEMAEAGWAVRDCGGPAVRGLGDAPRADAVLIRIPIPEDPTQVSALWGGDQALPGLSSNKRDALLARLAIETDPYTARDLRNQVERTIVEEGLAAPIAMNATVAVSTPSLEGARLGSGTAGSLLAGAAGWSPTR